MNISRHAAAWGLAVALPLSVAALAPATAHAVDPSTSETITVTIEAPVSINGDLITEQQGKVLGKDGGLVTDVVEAQGLVAGKSYELTVELMALGVGESVEPTGITASQSFTAEFSDAIEMVDLTVPAGYEGRLLVAFETLRLGGEVVASTSSTTNPDTTLTIAIDPPMAPVEDADTTPIDGAPIINGKPISELTDEETAALEAEMSSQPTAEASEGSAPVTKTPATKDAAKTSTKGETKTTSTNAKAEQKMVARVARARALKPAAQAVTTAATKAPTTHPVAAQRSRAIATPQRVGARPVLTEQAASTPTTTIATTRAAAIAPTASSTRATVTAAAAAPIASFGTARGVVAGSSVAVVGAARPAAVPSAVASAREASFGATNELHATGMLAGAAVVLGSGAVAIGRRRV